MDILIITNFTSDFSLTDNDRFLYLAKMLTEDNDVEILTSDFCHEKKTHRYQTTYEWPFKITFLSETGYPKNVCLKRFYSHYVWGKNVRKYLQNRKKPDVIYCAVPSLTGPFEAAKYCKKNGVRFVIDVQDLWPEAFQMVLNIPVLSNIIFAPFKYMVNRIYGQADDIVAVSQTYVDRALSVNKKCNAGHAIYLGTDLSTFDDNAKKDFVLEKHNGEIWIGYCGTLGKSYDLKCVINALDVLKNPKVRLIVMGDGPFKSEFEQYAREKMVNVFFAGRLPYDNMCSLLCACDIVANPIIGTSVATIINKHADYVASGLPVINTQDSREYINLIEKYNMGFSVPPGDFKEFANKLNILVNDESLRKEMGRNARLCAEQRFDRKSSYQKIAQVILE